ncbi:MAG: endonuclease/exonuclease/phosphatase family protein [Candidatus Marinimicrobia bacterium]|nr:endonuclease/exonuclease/phosphatase family protein [Candidatus Neomarinimicrobiota bacterium]MBL7022552.1 endonuclease/exonuclease/phosphatase family protein [Candidatus Neomarinimicrobiota bacterium]MBL7108908.1 endonuclease/exonuclease/phosphatase family protein [Candidatus Neomarinimicrobiota bacterium]
MKKILLILTLALTLNNCDIFNTQFEDLEDAVLYQASSLTEAPTSVDSLIVMTWNVKFGGARIDFWFDCYGERVIMTENEVMDNIEALADYIEEVNPDIVLLQEVDVNSKRSAYIDQLQYLLDNTDLNYGAYASQWKADFIPSSGLGKMESGNAILSKWALTDAERIALPLISEDDALTQYFYLKRNILKAKIDLLGYDNLWALNIHASAYSNDGTKKLQLDQFKDELDFLDSSDELFIAGGDFNSLPPNTIKVNEFDDSICEDEDFQGDDYSEESEWLDEFYTDYEPAVTLDKYGTTEETQFNHYSHTVQGPPEGFWSRKLDYLFTNLTWVENSDSTHQETMDLSDHAPLTSTLSLEN